MYPSKAVGQYQLIRVLHAVKKGDTYRQNVPLIQRNNFPCPMTCNLGQRRPLRRLLRPSGERLTKASRSRPLRACSLSCSSTDVSIRFDKMAPFVLGNRPRQCLDTSAALGRSLCTRGRRNEGRYVDRGNLRVGLPICLLWIAKFCSYE